MKANICLVGIALATPLDIFRDVREKTYLQIENSLSHYRNLMKNQIPSQDFKPSFELCSDGEYVTRETMLECFPFDLQNDESSVSKNFTFNSWESIDQDFDGKLDFTEWKGYIFALGYINFKVIHHGFGGAEEFLLNEEETGNLLDYAHAWLSTKSSEDNRIFFDNLFKSIDIDKNPNNLTHLEAIRLFVAILTKFMEK